MIEDHNNYKLTVLVSKILGFIVNTGVLANVCIVTPLC